MKIRRARVPRMFALSLLRKGGGCGWSERAGGAPPTPRAAIERADQEARDVQKSDGAQEDRNRQTIDDPRGRKERQRGEGKHGHRDGGGGKAEGMPQQEREEEKQRDGEAGGAGDDHDLCGVGAAEVKKKPCKLDQDRGAPERGAEPRALVEVAVKAPKIKQPIPQENAQKRRQQGQEGSGVVGFEVGENAAKEQDGHGDEGEEDRAPFADAEHLYFSAADLTVGPGAGGDAVGGGPKRDGDVGEELGDAVGHGVVGGEVVGGGGGAGGGEVADADDGDEAEGHDKEEAKESPGAEPEVGGGRCFSGGG
jgi:hypothetical protein